MRLTTLTLLLLLVGSCSTGSFVGRRFDNFTAYYNTFYNARKSFNAAVKSSRRADQKVDRDVFLTIFDPGNPSASGRDFDNAIKKSADVLRDHPDSKWVDDALLLIGKSYYYTGNTVGSEQKFREVIERESPLEDEARFWLGLSLIAAGSYDAAGEHLRESVGRDGMPRKWESRMRLALGELYVRQERWEEAAEELEAGAKNVGDGELASRGTFLLGQVWEQLGKYDLAVEAYEGVRKHNPNYELSYASRFDAVRVEGVYGDADRALGELRKMERDDKHFAYRAELAYLRGMIYQASGRAEDAVETYQDVLYATDANISTVRGPIHYRLATLFRDDVGDFMTASAYFDTASTQLTNRANVQQVSGGAKVVTAPSPSAIRDAAEQSRVFDAYTNFRSQVADLDSLLYLGSLDKDAFTAKIQEIRRRKAEELLAARRREQERAVAAGFGRTTAAAETRPNQTTTTQASSTAGFLFHRDRSRVQEGLLSFFDRWGERPLAPNWRRRAAIAQVDRDGDPQAQNTPEPGDAAEATSTTSTDALLGSVELDLSEIPRTDEQRSDMRQERAAARYELANVLFLSIGLPDSAAAWYRKVVDEDSDRPVAARALYALGEVQLALGDDESADELFRRVIDRYPGSDVAERSAERLGLVVDVANEAEADPAEAAYEDAFKEWAADSLETAFERMLTLAAKYPDSPIRPRALLAAGTIWSDWASSSGHAVTDQIGLNVADSVWLQLGLEPTVAPMDTAASVDSPVTSDTVSSSIEPEVVRDSLSADTLLALPELAVDTAAVELPAPPPVSADPDTVLGASFEISPDTVGSSSGDSPMVAQVARFVVTIEDLYQLIMTDHPDSEHAAAARRLSAVLAEARKEAAVGEAAKVEDVARGEQETPSEVGRADDEEPVGRTRRAEERLRAEDNLRFRGDRVAIDEPDREDADTGAGAEPGIVHESVDVEPIPVGGRESIQRMVRYPAEARSSGTTGTVEVTFIVDERGRVLQPVVASPLGAGCDEEALRVVNLMRFRPAIKDGEPVSYRMSLALSFFPPVNEAAPDSAKS